MIRTGPSTGLQSWVEKARGGMNVTAKMVAASAVLRVCRTEYEKTIQFNSDKECGVRLITIRQTSK